MGNVRLVSPQAYDVRVTALIPAGGVANTRTVGNIEVQAGIPAQTMVLVPGNEIWHIEDVFIVNAAAMGAGTMNCRLEIMVNSAPQPMTPTLLVTSIADPTRLKLPRSIMVPAAGNITINFVQLVANATVSSDVACHLKIMRYPVV